MRGLGQAAAAAFAAVLVTAAVMAGFAGPAAAAAAPVAATTAPSNESALTVPGNDDCLHCHGRADQKATVDVNGEKKSVFVDKAVYDFSRHGKLACTICHLGFKPGPHDAAQTDGWLQTAKLTACRSCHSGVFGMYRGSFHGDLVFSEAGGKAPVCADCHVAHNITSPGSASFRDSIPGLCTRCHADADRTYLNSYHGKAFFLGQERAAVCSDCHGGHRILPASDPASKVSEHNLVATCAQCHPGANENFAGFMVHIDPGSPRSSFAVWTVNLLYILLISVVFTFGAVHSALYIYRGYKDGLYSRNHSG